MAKKVGHVRNRSGRNTDQVIDDRRKTLQILLNDSNKNYKPLTPKELLASLHKKGYKLDSVTLWKDRKYLASQNSFVRDIAEATYSEIVENSFVSIRDIRNRAMRLSEQKWVITKVKTKGVTRNNPTEFINEGTDSEFLPKEKFLRLALDCNNAMLSIMKGETLNYSVSFLSKKLHTQENELNKIRAREESAKA